MWWVERDLCFHQFRRSYYVLWIIRRVKHQLERFPKNSKCKPTGKPEDWNDCKTLKCFLQPQQFCLCYLFELLLKHLKLIAQSSWYIFKSNSIITLVHVHVICFKENVIFFFLKLFEDIKNRWLFKLKLKKQIPSSNLNIYLW